MGHGATSVFLGGNSSLTVVHPALCAVCCSKVSRGAIAGASCSEDTCPTGVFPTRPAAVRTLVVVATAGPEAGHEGFDLVPEPHWVNHSHGSGRRSVMMHVALLQRRRATTASCVFGSEWLNPWETPNRCQKRPLAWRFPLESAPDPGLLCHCPGAPGTGQFHRMPGHSAWDANHAPDPSHS